MEEKLKALVHQRKAVEDKLMRVKTAVPEKDAGLDKDLQNVHFLNVKLKTVENCYGEFYKFQNQIYALELTAGQRKEHGEAELEFEALYNTLTIKLSELLENVAKTNVPAIPAAVPSFLPPLNVPLPTFDGTYENWFSFKCLFQNVMARYRNEPPAIKLYHLRNSLVGKAAGVIDQDIVNNNDYEAAWEILRERFEDKRTIIDKHIATLLTLPKITQENVPELRKLIDCCVKNVEALKALGLPVGGLGEQILVNLLAARMDRETRKEWEADQIVGELPTYAATIGFLAKRFKILERIEPNSVQPERSVTMALTDACRCDVCGQQHELMDCERFKAGSVNERYRQLRKWRRCFNCMAKGHPVAECASRETCQLCRKRHHTMLHTDGTTRIRMTSDALKMSDGGGPQSEPTDELNSTSSPDPMKKQVLLSTVVVLVDGDNGPHMCRALIDSCSQSNFVTEKFANLLALQKERVAHQVSGLNSGITKVSSLIRAKIKSRVTSYSTELEFLVTPRILDGMPSDAINTKSWNLPAGIKLADPKFNTNEEIDMLLGAEVFWDLLKADKIKLADNLPTLRDTELGWIIGGVLTDREVSRTRTFCGVVKQRACQAESSWRSDDVHGACFTRKSSGPRINWKYRNETARESREVYSWRSPRI